jgi:hypothetical protein
MSLLPMAANAAWFLANYSAYVAFTRALDDPRSAQTRLLRDAIARNIDTDFGRRHGFNRIDSVDAFRRAVPMRGYDDLAPDIDRVAAGEANVLTAEPVLRMGTSSGSTRARKLLPYTRTLQREFNRAIGPWIVDLYQSDPALMCGSAYWSITPAVSQPEDSVRAVNAPPIGFEEDSAYLGGWRKRLVDAVMAVPGDVACMNDIAAFRLATLRHLLLRRDLRLISVWHPSFLDLLLDAAVDHWDQFVADVTILDNHRGAELRDLGPGAWTRIWPHLALVSCWADAHTAGPAEALRQRLPSVRFQPKGLLATEAFVTIPFAGARPLAVRSHFFEFVANDGCVLLADELRHGKSYAVVVTTGGGLWRYPLGDRVQVEGFLGRTPSLRFVGREDQVVDRFGEKLSEGFVGETIRRVLAEAAVVASFAMVAPETSGSEGRYTLYLESRTAPPATLVERLDTALRANPHYAYCRKLGQLRAPAIFLIEGDAYGSYVQHLCDGGARLGDIKAAALSGDATWSDVFRGRRISGGLSS